MGTGNGKKEKVQTENNTWEMWVPIFNLSTSKGYFDCVEIYSLQDVKGNKGFY